MDSSMRNITDGAGGRGNFLLKARALISSSPRYFPHSDNHLILVRAPLTSLALPERFTHFIRQYPARCSISSNRSENRSMIFLDISM
jgi:hypothetical protein